MTNWIKQGFGPGTNVCARCKGDKPPHRSNCKWCRPCDIEMQARHVDGALDRPDTGLRVTRPTRIIK